MRPAHNDQRATSFIDLISQTVCRALSQRAALLAFIAAGLAVAGLLGGCELLPEPAPPVPTLVIATLPTPTPTPYPTVTVQRGDIEEVVKVRGQVASLQEANLFFETTGWLKELNAEVGDLVEQGATLAVIDAPSQRQAPLQEAIVDAEYEVKFKTLELRQAESEPIDAAMQRARVAVKKAEIALQGAQTAYDKIAWQGDVTGRPEAMALQRADVDYQAAQADYLVEQERKDAQALRIEMLQTKLAYAELAAQRARARLEEARTLTELVAPFSGLLIALDKKIGDQVTPYEPIGVLADPSVMRIEAIVPEEDMRRVAFGQAVRIAFDAYADRQPLAGTVTGIASRPTIWQGRNAYEVTIDFDNPAEVPATIRMGADVEIVTRRVSDVIVAPVGAIIREDGREYVDLVVGNELVRAPVQTGLSDGKWIEVMSGLAEGESIHAP